MKVETASEEEDSDRVKCTEVRTTQESRNLVADLYTDIPRGEDPLKALQHSSVTKQWISISDCPSDQHRMLRMQKEKRVSCP